MQTYPKLHVIALQLGVPHEINLNAKREIWATCHKTHHIMCMGRTNLCQKLCEVGRCLIFKVVVGSILSTPKASHHCYLLPQLTKTVGTT